MGGRGAVPDEKLDYAGSFQCYISRPIVSGHRNVQATFLMKQIVYLRLLRKTVFLF